LGGDELVIFCYSNNDEVFPFAAETETLEEAVEEAHNSYPGEQVFVGVRQSVHPETWLAGEYIEERLFELAYEAAGEAAEGWPSFSDEDVQLLTERLQKLLQEFLEETGNSPTFYVVNDVVSFQPEEPGE